MKGDKKQGRGLLTYVSDKYSTHCEPLPELDKSDNNIEAQWIMLHRPHC